MGPRRAKPTNRKPTFFWQGVLILAPVLVLAKLGAYALWKDQRIAIHEAEVRARDLAEEAAGRIWDELEMGTFPAIEFDRAGNLLSPKPFHEVPVPQPLNEEELNADQRKLWSTARQVFTSSDTPESFRQAASAYEDFLRSNPPRAFAAVAHFNRGVALERMGQKPDAAQEFGGITNHYADAFSEAGLPLDFLARAHLQPANDFVRYAIENPCPLTPQIVAQFALTGGNASVLALWSKHELLRRLSVVSRGFFQATNLTLPTAPTNSGRPIETRINTPAMFWVTNYESRGLTNYDAKTLTETAKRSDGSLLPPSAEVLSPITQEEVRYRSNPSPFQLPSSTGSTTWITTVQGVATILAPTNSLMIRTVTPDGFALTAQPESKVFEAVRNVLSRISHPEWLDFTVTVAGRELIRPDHLSELKYTTVGKGSGQAWRREASGGGLLLLGNGTRAEAGHGGVTVSAWLVSRDLLLSQQRLRTMWFGFVIAAAAGASIVGFVSAYRAFNKQHRLAEMKSNFVSSVSHELRAPIASIRLMAEGLERGKISEPAKQHDYFKFMVQECRRLSSMIENVLDFARIEQGRKQYEFEPVDVAALIAQTVKLMEPYAAERGVRLLTKIEANGGRAEMVRPTQPIGSSPSPPGTGGEGRAEEWRADFIANLDGQAMQQAVVNLIDNAIKHSPEGEEVIITLGSLRADSPLSSFRGENSTDQRIAHSTPERACGLPLPRGEGRGEGEHSVLKSVRPRVESLVHGKGEANADVGRVLSISVEDRGPGVPVAERQKIFERFYRLGSELRRETPGVGIGLSIVKHVVEAHGGSVRVESEVGKGSRFTIEVPVDGKRKGA